MLYIVASLVTSRLAGRFGNSRFLAIVMGGLLARMAVALVAVALVLVWLPVDALPFVGAFFAVFTVGLVGEVLLMHRYPVSGSAGTPDHDDSDVSSAA